MAQSHLTITLRHFTWVSGLSVCFLFNGCATLIHSSTSSLTADEHSESQQRSAHSRFNDPFRPLTPTVQEHRNPTGEPFSWLTAGTTAAGEPLQIAATGDGGFRSLIVGSVGGHDPVAIKLTEDLARYLHDNQVIMGGVDTTILRTLNPDGLKQHKHNNADGVYLNNLFPKHGEKKLSIAQQRQLPKEVQFLIDLTSEQHPHRIIHIRTVRDSGGMLAVSQGATDTAHEVAEWLGFSSRELPQDVSRGTLESWAAQRGDCTVITIGIPHQTKAKDAWELYGDAILSLLMDGDSESRQLAREQKQRRSANRRNEWSQPNDDSFDEMFRNDSVDDTSDKQLFE